MSSSKTHRPHTQAKQRVQSVKTSGSRATTTMRPTSTSKAPIAKPSVQPVRAIPPLSKPSPQPARAIPPLPKPGPQPARAQPPLSKPGTQPPRMQDSIAKSGAQPARAQPPGAKQVRETPGPAHRASSGSAKAKALVSQATGTNVSPSSYKGKTPWTVEAAGRIASTAARKGDGTVKKGSFAADTMSRAMTDECNGKREK